MLLLVGGFAGADERLLEFKLLEKLSFALQRDVVP
jgi:hypothetical protein